MPRRSVLLLMVFASFQIFAQPLPRDLRDAERSPERLVVLGEPRGPIALSGGAATPAEIADFERLWMHEAARASARDGACWMLYARFDAGVWGTYEYMGAMARMYALTRNPIYIAQMDAIATCALLYRDDRHPGPRAGESLAAARYLRPRPLDQIRNQQSLPAWGGRSINSANLHHVSEVVSSLYAYSIASFARIVLEDPSLHAQYAINAVASANAAIETIALFLTQFEMRNDGPYHQGFLVNHPNLRNRWTRADCDRAFNETIAAESPPPPSQETIDWFNKKRTNCKRAIELNLGGRPMSHNEMDAFAMAMIELTRVLGTPAYQQHPDAKPSAYFWRNSLPLFVSRIQRYFNRALVADRSGPNRRYIWRHSELTGRWEDSSHAGLSMQYVVVLARDLDALDRVARAAEPIAFAPADLRLFATTFTRMNLHPDMALDVRNATPTSKDNNALCFAWLDLSVVDQRVYDLCKERVLRIVDGKQPNLTIGNHAALLVNGRAR